MTATDVTPACRSQQIVRFILDKSEIPTVRIHDPRYSAALTSASFSDARPLGVCVAFVGVNLGRYRPVDIANISWLRSAKWRKTAIDAHTTRHVGYDISQRCRERIEEVFGWIKSSAGFAKIKLRGRARVDAAFTGACGL